MSPEDPIKEGTKYRQIIAIASINATWHWVHGEKLSQFMSSRHPLHWWLLMNSTLYENTVRFRCGCPHLKWNPTDKRNNAWEESRCRNRDSVVRGTSRFLCRLRPSSRNSTFRFPSSTIRETPPSVFCLRLSRELHPQHVFGANEPHQKRAL